MVNEIHHVVHQKWCIRLRAKELRQGLSDLLDHKHKIT